MTFERNPNHAEHGILKFAAPFWGKPRWAALFVALARQIQELENASWDVIESRMLSNATGVRLRVLGALVGQLDPGLGDEVFRSLIRVKIRVNRSGAQRDDMLRVLQALGIPLAQRQLVDAPPAKYLLFLSGAIPLPLPLLVKVLGNVAGAGIGVIVVHADSFAFTDNTTTPGANGAWSDNDITGVPWGAALQA